MGKLTYLDNAATTKMFADEFDFMKENNDTLFFNPSAAYLPARKVSAALNSAREDVASALKGSNGKLYSGNGISTDIIGASIRAYISAVNKIVFEQNV